MAHGKVPGRPLVGNFENFLNIPLWGTSKISVKAAIRATADQFSLFFLSFRQVARIIFRKKAGASGASGPLALRRVFR
jgi:hypothetical protein